MGHSSSALPHTNLCFDYGMLVNIKITLREERILPFKSLQILFQISSNLGCMKAFYGGLCYANITRQMFGSVLNSGNSLLFVVYFNQQTGALHAIC